MRHVDRLQGLAVTAAALAGLAVGVTLPGAPVLGALVVPLLVVLLTAVFVQVDLGEVRAVAGARRLVAASLALNFIVTPALAWALGTGLLGDSPDLRLGLLLLLVTPCTDWYLVFTALARGHVGIATALLPVNLVLQLLLLPVYVVLLGGVRDGADVPRLAASVVAVLVVPVLLAWVVRRVVRRHAGTVRGWASGLTLPVLCLAVLAMVAAHADLVVDEGPRLLLLVPPLLVFLTVAPLLAVASAHALRLPADRRVTLVMTATARNSPVALAVAVAAFPDRPLVALALVVGPLVELPALAVIAQLVRAGQEVDGTTGRAPGEGVRAVSRRRS